MLQATRTWRERCVLDDLVAEIEHDLDVPRLVARLLVGRGISDLRGAERFLGRRLADLHPPESMRDMERAAARFAAAIEGREPILVHGDYDVDGCTATALLALFCRACGHDAIAWIPDRRIDGYGLGEASRAAVRDHGSRLMITVDCGIADRGWAARIEAECGCDVIVTDHHLPGEELPRCTAVCNPNRRDCDYPDPGLAGVGIAWKLCWATAKVLCGAERVTERLRGFLLDNLALVALGTVADCAPLVDENRIMVHHGLRRLATSTRPGLRALLRETRLGEHLTANDIGWRLGPLLNAAGRLGSAMPNIELLCTDDDAVAEQLVAGIVRDNEERRRLTGILSADLIHEVETNPERYAHRSGLVFAGEGWHAGVVGIVASRLVDRFAKPCAVIAIDGERGKGSLRSVPAVDLGRAIATCQHALVSGGGHAMAAGIVVATPQLTTFEEAFDDAIRMQQPGGLPPADLVHDGVVTVGALTGELFTTLERLAPFGVDNPEPVLRINRAFFVTPPILFGRNGNHLKGALSDDAGGMRQFMMWNARDHYSALSARGRRFDLLVRPETSWFRREPEYRLVFVDGTAV